MFENNDIDARVKIKTGDFIFALTIILATLANFTDFTLSFHGISRITATSVLVYLVTMTTYNHFFAKGKVEGKQDAEYLEIVKKFESERDLLIAEGRASRIPQFVEEYVRNELVEFRKSILVQYGIGYCEYEDTYMRMPVSELIRKRDLQFRAKLAIMRCNRAKPVSLSQKEFLASSKNSVSRTHPIGVSGRTMEQLDITSQAVRRLVISAFSGVVGVDLVFNLSWESVVTWAIRMLPIITALLTGQSNGYKNITETEAGYKSNQLYMLQQFKEWCKKGLEPPERISEEKQDKIDEASLQVCEKNPE